MKRSKPFTGILSTQEMLQAIETLEGKPVPERTLTYWTHDGLVPASVRGQRGRRVERWYSRADLLRLRVIVRLKKLGLSLQRIRKALEQVDRSDPKALEAGRGTLVVSYDETTSALITLGAAPPDLGSPEGVARLRLRDVLDDADSVAEAVAGMGR